MHEKRKQECKKNGEAHHQQLQQPLVKGYRLFGQVYFVIQHAHSHCFIRQTNCHILEPLWIVGVCEQPREGCPPAYGGPHLHLVPRADVELCVPLAVVLDVIVAQVDHVCIWHNLKLVPEFPHVKDLRHLVIAPCDDCLIIELDVTVGQVVWLDEGPLVKVEPVHLLALHPRPRIKWAVPRAVLCLDPWLPVLVDVIDKFLLCLGNLLGVKPATPIECKGN